MKIRLKLHLLTPEYLAGSSRHTKPLMKEVYRKELAGRSMSANFSIGGDISLDRGFSMKKREYFN
jgi:hypothetical protein